VEAVFSGCGCAHGIKDVLGVEEEEAYGHAVQVCALKIVGQKIQTASMIGDMFGDVQVCHAGRRTRLSGCQRGADIGRVGELMNVTIAEDDRQVRLSVTREVRERFVSLV